MTAKARVVLQDVKFAIHAHNNKLQSEAFRISWFAIIGLLRAIGHVLEKVDSKSSPEMADAIKENWKELVEKKPEPKIFWQFIDQERNRFLKNYEHGISRTLTVDTLIPNMQMVVDAGNSQGGSFGQGSELDSQISDGPFAGHYEKRVAWEAYDWWESYLDEIDRLYQQNLSSLTKA